MSKKRQVRTIAVDFDGVLHDYDGYKGGRILGPRDGALDAVNALLEAGHTVVVFTTRPADLVQPWLAQHGFPDLEVTSHKRPFWAIIDDRAIRFNGDWQETLRELDGLEPYWIRNRSARETDADGS